LSGEIFQGEGGGRPMEFLKALPALPPAAPSWWRSDADLAGAGESIPALASRFGGQVTWLHESLQPGSPHRGQVAPGIRIERMTLPLRRISLLSNQSLRDERLQPERLNREWDPSVEANCANWVGAFSFGDADAATLRRNGGEAAKRAGPLTLFRFWSARPLPAGPARWTHQSLKLDRDKTGFAAVELRSVDVDGDGIADLVWLQATGRGPGHIEGPPAHDDPWWRLLLANVAGRWRILDVDTYGYGCGC
jgi:hypothetical protein